MLCAVCLSMLLAPLESSAQIRSYDFKKGEVIYIILTHQRKGSDELFKKYRQDFFPMAMEYTYAPFWDGFLLIDEVLQGGNTYDGVVLGKWGSKAKRKEFAKMIYEVAPDFDKKRREIWYSFDQTTYDVKEDMTLSVNMARYNVYTTLWCDKARHCRSYAKKWTSAAEKEGGKVLLYLTDGSSPSGYYYLPDVLLLSEWPSRSAYERFATEMNKIDASCVVNINEFQLQ